METALPDGKWRVRPRLGQNGWRFASRLSFRIHDTFRKSVKRKGQPSVLAVAVDGGQPSPLPFPLSLLPFPPLTLSPLIPIFPFTFIPLPYLCIYIIQYYTIQGGMDRVWIGYP